MNTSASFQAIARKGQPMKRKPKMEKTMKSWPKGKGAKSATAETARTRRGYKMMPSDEHMMKRMRMPS
jgi:hypothetical protein